MAIRPPNYRLADDTMVGGVKLAISELTRSLSSDTTVLGIRVLTQTKGFAPHGVDGSSTPLVELQEVKGIRPVPRRRLLGLFHCAILLPDRPALGRFLG